MQVFGGEYPTLEVSSQRGKPRPQTLKTTIREVSKPVLLN